MIRNRLVQQGKFTFQPISSTNGAPPKKSIDFFRTNEETATKSNTGGGEEEDTIESELLQGASRIMREREHGVTHSYKQALLSLKIPPVPQFCE